MSGRVRAGRVAEAPARRRSRPQCCNPIRLRNAATVTGDSKRDVAAVGGAGALSATRRAVAALAAVSVLAVAPTAALALPPDPPKIVQTRALGRLTVRAQSAVRLYDRREFGSGFTSSGGCGTNEAVLLRDGLDARKGPGCKVSATHCRSVYDGVTLTSRSDVQIDHIVALANAWRSGASRWSRADRVRFASDLDDPELIAVSATSKRIKSDQGPEDWKPRRRLWCLYARWWIDVKTVWRLTVTGAEKRALCSMLIGC
jgi:hypothetical protein